MSSNKGKTEKSFPMRVLVRAFDAEPASLQAVGRLNDRAIEVFGSDPTKTIGFHNQDVFLFDAELFAKLSQAYRKGNKKALADLWGQAKPIVRAKGLGS